MNNRNDLIAIEKLYHWLSLSKFRDLPEACCEGPLLRVFFSFVIHHSKCLQKDCLETQIWTFTVRPLLENRIQTHFCGIQRFTRSGRSLQGTLVFPAAAELHTLLLQAPLEHRLHLSSMKLADSSLASLSEWNFPLLCNPVVTGFILHLRELTVCREHFQVWILGWRVLAEYLWTSHASL